MQERESERASESEQEEGGLNLWEREREER